MTQLARVYLMLRGVRSRASLMLAFSFVLVASSQNLQSPLPRGSVPDSSKQLSRPATAMPELQRALPRTKRIPPDRWAGSDPANVQATGVSAQSQLFLDTSAPQYATGDFPGSLAVGDLNGDGNADLAVTSKDFLSVLLGNGDGTFRVHVDYATTSSPLSVAIGDFNGDRKSDLVVTNSNDTVSVLVGNGDGTFQSHVDYATGHYPGSVAIGDFNGDDKADLVVTNYSDNSVSVLLGNGNGTFQPHVDYATGAPPLSMAVGDFNGDDKADVAVTLYSESPPYASSVSVLRGNGDGTFQTHMDYPTGNNPTSVAIGDFNGDGRPDLVVTNYYNTSVSVLLGNGDGTFQPHVDFATGSPPWSVAVGDFNGDGKADLVITNPDENSVSVLLGNGDGTFQPHVDYTTGSSPGSEAIGDFNGDGKADLVITNPYDNSVSVLLGNGDGTFPNPPHYETGNGPYSLAVGDFNGDGKADLAVTNSSDNSVSVLLGNGDGSFRKHVDYATGSSPISVAVGDFNGDHKMDLAVTRPNSVSILLGNGDGSFQTVMDYATANRPLSIAVDDFNGDSKADLAIPSESDHFEEIGSVSVLLGNGDGSFQAYVDYARGISSRSEVVGDFNGDGSRDLAVTNYWNYSVSVLLGNGDGTFQTPMVYATRDYPTSIATGDFNGDGKADLAVTNQGFAFVSVLLGNGDSTFQTGVEYASGNNPIAMAVGDFNGDGKADLAVTNESNSYPLESSVNVLIGNDDGSFQTGMDYAKGQVSREVVVADFNGDGAPDLAFLTLANSVGILLNIRGTVVELQSSGSPSTLGQLVTFTASVRASLTSSGIDAPSGTVAFLDGTEELGSETLSVSGAASFSTATLNAGTHSITVAYRGDDNFNPHTSAALKQVVVVEAQDFRMSATPGSATVTSGSSVEFTIASTAMNGFNGQVSLSCMVSPSPAFTPTCALNPTSVTPAANGSATSKLTVRTTGSTASLRPMFHHGSSLLYALWLPIFSLAVLGVGFGADQPRKKIPGGLLVILVLAGLGLQEACGGGSPGSSGTPPGQYTVTVNATSGSIAHTTAVTVVVR